MTKRTNEQAHNAVVETIEAAKSANAPLTAEAVEDAVDSLMLAASSVFQEPEERVKGDNGKFYPLDYDWSTRTDGAQSTGEIVTVNRFRFLENGILRGVCQALEFMHASQMKSIEEQRNSIQNLFRFGRNAGTDVDIELSRKEDFLAHQIEQAAIIEIALKQAAVSHFGITGQPYSTKKEREALAKARLEQTKPDRLARLKALGVTID
jgi:hypothetical protein